MKQKSQPRTNQKKKKITLMGTLANCSTDGARKLLRKYGKEDALNHEDLELKLSQLYASVEDKKKLEKELAEIHPHKEFILMYLSEKPESKDLESETKIKEIAMETLPIVEQKSNCSGCSSFSSCSGATGAKSCGTSNASGSENNQSPSQPMISMSINTTTLAIVGLIGLFTLVVVKKL